MLGCYTRPVTLKCTSLPGLVRPRRDSPAGDRRANGEGRNPWQKEAESRIRSGSGRQHGPEADGPIPSVFSILLATLALVLATSTAGCSIGGGGSNGAAATPTPRPPTPRPAPTRVVVAQPAVWKVIAPPGPGQLPVAPPKGSYPFARSFGGLLVYVPGTLAPVPASWQTYSNVMRGVNMSYPPRWIQQGVAGADGALFLPPPTTQSRSQPGGPPAIGVLWSAGAAGARKAVPLPALGDGMVLDGGIISAGKVSGHLYTIGGTPGVAARVEVPAKGGMVTLFVRADDPAMLDVFRQMLSSLRVG